MIKKKAITITISLLEHQYFFMKMEGLKRQANTGERASMQLSVRKLIDKAIENMSPSQYEDMMNSIGSK